MKCALSYWLAALQHIPCLHSTFGGNGASLQHRLTSLNRLQRCKTVALYLSDWVVKLLLPFLRQPFNKMKVGTSMHLFYRWHWQSTMSTGLCNTIICIVGGYTKDLTNNRTVKIGVVGPYSGMGACTGQYGSSIALFCLASWLPLYHLASTWHQLPPISTCLGFSVLAIAKIASLYMQKLCLLLEAGLCTYNSNSLFPVALLP